MPCPTLAGSIRLEVDVDKPHKAEILCNLTQLKFVIVSGSESGATRILRTMQPDTPFDTTNFLFICGGAFVGLEDIIAKRLGRGGFGFDQLSENCQVNVDGLLRHLKPADLEAFGLNSEINLSVAGDCAFGRLSRGRSRPHSSVDEGR